MSSSLKDGQWGSPNAYVLMWFFCFCIYARWQMLTKFIVIIISQNICQALCCRYTLNLYGVVCQTHLLKNYVNKAYAPFLAFYILFLGNINSLGNLPLAIFTIYPEFVKCIFMKVKKGGLWKDSLRWQL